MDFSGSFLHCGVKKIICAFVLLAVAIPAASQEDEEILRAAMYVWGASSEEELSEYQIEEIQSQKGRKIRINSPWLRSGGVLSDYQAASIRDYRSRSGDILSWEELALVDGFGSEAVQALKPFLSLESHRAPGKTDTVKLKASAILRTTLNSVGGKAKVSTAHLGAGGAWRGKDGSFYATANYRGHSLIVGDHKLRFGQGLILWEGFSMTSLSTVDAFVLKANGASTSWSYSSSGLSRGLVYEYQGSRFRTLAFGALDGSFGVHGDYYFRNGQIGLSACGLDLAVSADLRYNYRKSDLALEAAYKNKSGAYKGAWRLRPGSGFHLALQGRVIPSKFSGKKYGEYGFAAGIKWKGERNFTLSTTADASLLPIPETAPGRFQLRIYSNGDIQFNPIWALSLRFTERYRNYEAPRSDLRADLKFTCGNWMAVYRNEGVHCEHYSWLTYLEGGWKGESLAAYLRLSAFIIDKWNDRIYTYERDAPGNFNVPAYYGRGFAVWAYASWKRRFFSRITLKLYLKGGYLIRKERENSPTLNFQLQCEY